MSQHPWLRRLDSLRSDWWRQWQRGRTLGARGERVAAKLLKRKRYHLIETQARNVFGEIDIIAVDERTVVFAEVKTRRSHDAGHPADAVTEQKQARISRSALAYLKHHDLLRVETRFDIVAITWPLGQRKPNVEHFQNAFTPAASFPW